MKIASQRTAFASKLACLATLLFAQSALAVIPSDGAYIGLQGGLSLMPSINLRSPSPVYVTDLYNRYNPLASTGNFLELQRTFVFAPSMLFPGFGTFPRIKSSVDHGLGGDFGAQLGYRVCNFRFEAELLFNYAPVKELKLGGETINTHVTPINPFRISGQTGFGALFANAFYDFYDEDNDPTWVPYLGLGIGYSYVRNTTTITIPYFFQRSFNFSHKTSRSAPIGQGIIGISYYYSDTLSFGLDYRYISTNNISEFGSRVSTNTVNLNFNYWFGD
jgi:opacity protein-like surface antigen